MHGLEDIAVLHRFLRKRREMPILIEGQHVANGEAFDFGALGDVRGPELHRVEVILQVLAGELIDGPILDQFEERLSAKPEILNVLVIVAVCGATHPDVFGRDFRESWLLRYRCPRCRDLWRRDGANGEGPGGSRLDCHVGQTVGGGGRRGAVEFRQS
jgi:hypothetical protein